MHGTRGVLLGLIATLFGASVAAQQVPPPGARVRVVGRTGDPVFATGAFLRLAGDTVVLTDSVGAMQAVTLELGRRWERSTGMKRHTLRGIGLGLLIGGGAGALLGLASHNPDGPGFDYGPGLNAAAGAVLLGVPGLVIGGIVGGKKHEHWRPIEAAAPRVVLVPTGSHRAAFVASISF